MGGHPPGLASGGSGVASVTPREASPWSIRSGREGRSGPPGSADRSPQPSAEGRPSWSSARGARIGAERRREPAVVKKLVEVQDDRKRTHVLDTSVLLSDPRAIARFAEHDVVLPVVVITELEAKRHHAELGYFARAALRALDDLRIK